LEDFETLEPQLKNRVQRDSRSELNQIFLIERLKKENEFKENKSAISKACAKADTTLRKGTWKFDEKDKNLKTVLFTIKDKSYTTKDFYNFVVGVQRERTGSPNYIMQQYYKQFVDKSILEYEEAHLAEKYLDYKMLVKEYRDGILLFQLMDEEVWSKALQDTAGLEAFHKQNENKYRWNERAKVTIYNAIDAVTLEEVKKAVQAKTFKINEPMLKDVKFVNNQSKLTDSTKQMLDAAVAFLKQDTTLTLQVTTYQDAKEKGKLTKPRLENIVAYLIEKGISAQRITPKEGGKLTPKKGEISSKAVLQLYGKTNRSLERSFNRSAPLRLQITEGKFQQGENPTLEKVTWKKGEYTVNINDRVAWVIVEDIEAPRNKTLDEAKGQIISDYQSYLEQQWIESLKKRYPVAVNQEAIKSLIKNK
jgi:peptidyl-prolyl cis-trans isomerase SurA